MTDEEEEMAIQFADNISGLDLTCSLLSAKDKSHAYRLGRYDGFLAGLKADRLQWHDLRKDPNDLPKENTEVLIYCYGNVRQAFFRRFFKSLYGDCRVEEVIAWCEIPTFDKE